MKIKWLEFKNNDTGLKIERVNFNKDLTLLVGISGVGKTQILNALSYSLELAVNSDIELRPYSVSLGIEVEGDVYEWSYNILKDTSEDVIVDSQERYYIAYEKLVKNNTIVYDRNKTEVKVEGFDRILQPKKNESLLSQYSEDEKFEELIRELMKTYSVEVDTLVRGVLSTENFSSFKSVITKRMKKTPSFDIFSHLPVPLKLYIVKNYYKDIYIKIFAAVKELFIEIEDIDYLEDKKREVYLVAIKVYGKKILQDDISNGMLKSIYYIIELYTMPMDSLVLIDEFENGLGVNCIDVLEELIITERKDLQFIITSHHPTIINGIDRSRWLIIDRNQAVVYNSSSEEKGIGDTRHDAYFNLINRWEFEGKI